MSKFSELFAGRNFGMEHNKELAIRDAIVKQTLGILEASAISVSTNEISDFIDFVRRAGVKCARGVELMVNARWGDVPIKSMYSLQIQAVLWELSAWDSYPRRNDLLAILACSKQTDEFVKCVGLRVQVTNSPIFEDISLAGFLVDLLLTEDEIRTQVKVVATHLTDITLDETMIKNVVNHLVPHWTFIKKNAIQNGNDLVMAVHSHMEQFAGTHLSWNYNQLNYIPPASVIGKPGTVSRTLHQSEVGEVYHLKPRQLGEAEIGIVSHCSADEVNESLANDGDTWDQRRINAQRSFEKKDSEFYEFSNGEQWFIANREYGQNPTNGYPMLGMWVLRDVYTGEYIDADRMRAALFERNNILH